MGNLLGAVELADVFHHLQAPLIVEVHIDIGHLGTFGRQEPLEHQAVAQGVEGGDVHRVCDQCARSRATARADADAVLLSPAHVLRNNQEVRGKALVANNLVFKFKALANVDAGDLLAVPILAVALGQALLALATELALMRLAGIEQRVVGQ